jgi:hypothetical protein
MNIDRLTELVLGRRFGTPTPDEEAELSALLVDDAARVEAERIDRILDAAPSASVEVGDDFAGRLATRLEVADSERRLQSWRRFLGRLAAANFGIAAGAIIYFLLQGSAAGPEGPARRHDAALDAFAPAAPPFARPAGR